ncbi:MAG: glycosyltransferase family 2 protein [Clostridia bacterium]|nr:glycosyltransferase family 2 protein [Clostridia bacterium]
MVYYPVIIPTLNRVDHLKRCLDSLMKNSGAENTEVYVAVDFPPSEKYQDGYIKVKEYLETQDFSVFKKFNVIYHSENLGPGGNSKFLEDLVKEKYDAFIYSEDDNDFSQNFLEYMNKGLELFKDDPDVICICGAKDTQWVNNDKNFSFSKLYAAYGLGCWFDKRQKEISAGTKIILPDKTYFLGKMYDLYKKNSGLFCVYVLSILANDSGLFWKTNGELNWCDTVHSIYMHFTDAVCVVPAVAKSRTWGNDGSGVNMNLLSDYDPEKDSPLDEMQNFEYDNIDGISFYDENYALGNDYLKPGRIEIIKAFFCYFVLLLFRGNRNLAVKILKKPRIIWKKIKK